MRVLLFSIICCLSLPLRLLAADFIIASPDQFVKDSLFKVDILLDTADTEINALSGTVSYQGNQLILEDVSAGGSVVSLWLDPPILEKSLNNRLEFSGLIPGGYSGSQAYLFSLIFKVPNSLADSVESKEATINLDNLAVLLNDGHGTKIELKAISKRLTALNNDNGSLAAADKLIYQEPIDKFPPEKFAPLLFSDPSQANSPTYLAFSSLDKQSGLSYYEIASSRDLTNNYQRLAWTKITSPHIIEDSQRRQYIYIKAVDRQGNFQVAVVNPLVDHNSVWPGRIILLIGVLLGCLILLFIIKPRFIKK